MEAPLDRVVIVLFQPQDVVNVAAIIRAMSNFGLAELRLVEPAAFDPYRILGIAHHTDAIVSTVRHCATLAEAVGDCVFILGTTGRPRKADHLVVTPRQAAPLLLQTAALAPDGARVALLFGPEQDGLPNEALDRCNGILTIPTAPANRSLNLAQAALVVMYELFVTSAGNDDEPVAQVAVEPAGDLAGGAEREAMFGALQELLVGLYPETTEARLVAALSRLRTMLMRAAPRAEEAAALTNLCRHAVRALHRTATGEP